nr:PIN domain-containing protein [Cognatishimia sp. F0-27]
MLDTCVLYPSVMRAVLLGAAGQGLFTPLWSVRILEEWARAARKIGPLGEAQARAEIALVQAQHPKAVVTWPPSLESRLWLPDSHDVHVLAAAVAGHADTIITLNAKDFPRHILAEEGLTRCDPDALLYGFWLDNPDTIDSICQSVLADAQTLSGDDWTMRALLKKARLPRLAKAVAP